MAENRTATKRTGSTKGFTAAERAAMKERARELKAEAAKADGEKTLLEKVAEHTAERMVRGGHAVFRRYRFGRATVRYIRWCDGHVALGLADAAEALQNSSVSAFSG